MSDNIPFLELGAGAQPSLHFAHANAYPPGSYRQFLSRLGQQYHVLAMEQRPLWPGERPEHLTSWHLFAGDLIRFLRQQQLEGIIGVGHSLGAVATMKAAVEEPTLFSHVVLIEPVFLPQHFLEMIEAEPERAANTPMVEVARKRRYQWPDRQAAFDHYRGKSVFQKWSDEILGDYIQAGLQEDENGGVELRFSREWESQIYATIPTGVWQQIPRITQPTLAICAADSDTLFPAAWQLWQELQPGATFIEVEDSTHLLLMEQPEKVSQLVIDFLENKDMEG